MRLILFDIDGTLLRCGTQVGEIFRDALQDVYGTTGNLPGYSFAGRTDPGIVLDLVGSSGFDQETIVRRLPTMRELYLERLGERLDPTRMRLLPGVVELLERLRGREDLTLGLLTGNWRGGAAIKLSPFDLARFFPFGAFGDDGFDRRELLPVALDRARAATGLDFRSEETLIVGDSVLDVACGRAHGVAVLAVATGYTSAAELDAAGADWVVPDLVDVGARYPLFAA